MRVIRVAALGAVVLVGCGTASTGWTGGPSETPFIQRRGITY